MRYIDALILFADKRWAVEVKISRSDLMRELDNLNKSDLWRRHTHGFYVMVPDEMLDFALGVVPREMGVMRTGTPTIARRSPVNRTPADLPYETWRRIARKLSAGHFASAA